MFISLCRNIWGPMDCTFLHRCRNQKHTQPLWIYQMVHLTRNGQVTINKSLQLIMLQLQIFHEVETYTLLLTESKDVFTFLIYPFAHTPTPVFSHRSTVYSRLIHPSFDYQNTIFNSKKIKLKINLFNKCRVIFESISVEMIVLVKSSDEEVE